MEQYIIQLVVFYLQSLGIVFFIGLGISYFLISSKKISLLTFFSAPVIGYFFLALVLTGAGYLNINTKISFFPIIIMLFAPTFIFLGDFIKKTHKQSGLAMILLKGILVAVPIISISLIILTPLFKYGAYAVYNDSYTYISIADYFRNHGFFEKANPNIVTWQTHVFLYQHIRARIGASYVLSALMNLSSERSSFWLLPAYQSFGLTIFLSAICSLVYQLKKKIFPTLLIVLFTYFSFMYSIAPLMDGFIPQIFGMAIFAFILTLIIQYKQKEISYLAYTTLLATSFAGMINVYTELAPFTGFVMLVFYFIQIDYRVFTIRVFIEDGLRFFCPILLSFLLFPIYYLFGLEYIKNVANAVVGYNQPFGLNQMFLWLYGQDPFIASTKLKQLILLLSVISSWIITIIGFKYSFKESKLTKKLFFSILLVFLTSIFFYRYFKLNAFQSGILGNSWSVWKLFGWSYIYILIFIVLGLDEAFKKIINRIFLSILLIIVFLGSAPIFNRMLVTTTLGMKQAIGTNGLAIKEFRTLENEYTGKDNSNIYIISHNRHPNHQLITSLFLSNSNADLVDYSKSGLLPGILEKYLKPPIKQKMEIWVDDAVPSISNESTPPRVLTYNKYSSNANVALFYNGFSTKEVLNEKSAIWLIDEKATLRLITKDPKKTLTMKLTVPKGISGDVEVVNNGNVIIMKTIDFDNPYNLELSNFSAIENEYKIIWRGPFFQLGNDTRPLRILFSDITWN